MSSSMKQRAVLVDAATAGDIAAIERAFAAGAESGERNELGLTALHAAVINTARLGSEALISVIRRLIAGGVSLEATEREGRTALYLAAELVDDLAVVKVLESLGAKVDVVSQHGIHVVVNALSPEVQAYLSERTGVPIPMPVPKRPSVRLSTAAWKAARVRLASVFAGLRESGLIVREDAGTTQDDGFQDCAEEYTAAGRKAVGFCFYTSQDLRRARSSGLLPLGYWGAPDGARVETEQVGHSIVDALRGAGFTVDWSGSSSGRPVVVLSEAPPTR